MPQGKVVAESNIQMRDLGVVFTFRKKDDGMKTLRVERDGHNPFEISISVTELMTMKHMIEAMLLG